MTEKWVRCPYCGHKIFKVTNEAINAEIEIKCSSCKKVYVVILLGSEVKFKTEEIVEN